MTREEEIRKATLGFVYPRCQLCNIQGQCKDIVGYCIELDSQEYGFIAGAKWADEHPKSPWINAKNELPTKGGHYLCMDENHYISALAFDGDKWVNTITFSDVSLEVVKYWMHIPNLPKE